MKKLLLILFFAFLFKNAFPQVSDTLGYISLAPSEFREEAGTAGEAMLIDVREYFEYKKSRIKNSVNIPASGNLEASTDTLDKDTRLFMYCTGGFRSRKVAKYFAQKGFMHVYSLDGGIMAWQKAGFPVDKKKLKKRHRS